MTKHPNTDVMKEVRPPNSACPDTHVGGDLPRPLSMWTLVTLAFSLLRGSELTSAATHGRSAACGLLALVCWQVTSANAEWKTETYDLVPGWNSLYLHVDPLQAEIDLHLQRTPVSQVWMWVPPISTAEFSESIGEPNSGADTWLYWNPADDNANLTNFVGNAAYLVYVENSYDDGSGNVDVTTEAPFSLSLAGKAVPPVYRWSVSGQNFIGFSTKAGSEPSFDAFFNVSDTLDNSLTDVFAYVGGELSASAPQNPWEVDDWTGTKVTRGSAFWIKDADYNRFFGTFSLTLQDSSGVHFGTALSSYTIRIENHANTINAVTLELTNSLTGFGTTGDGSDDYFGTPPLLVRGDLSTSDLTYSFTELGSSGLASISLAAEGEVGSVVEIVLGIDRSQMTAAAGQSYGGILGFTDSLGMMQIDVPTTAVQGSLEGLWVGEAEITQVQQDVAEYEVDDDGATALDDDGASVVSSTDATFGGVARSYSLRLIMHVDETGYPKLLQRIYYGLNETNSPMLATQQGFLNSDHLDAARRITAVHLPWSEENTAWSFDAKMASDATMTASVTTAFTNQAANPFIHTYHPDHDNRDAAYAAYSDDAYRGYESYEIVRDITLNAGKTLVTAAATTTSTSAATTSDSETIVIPTLPSGIAMIDLPQGVFTMGDTNASGPLADDHAPERLVYISPFEMSEAEITVQQYVDFLNVAMADGLITVAADSDDTFVYGATGQPYAGHKFLELSGTRVLKDHDGDGDIDPENPLNQCWIEFDGVGTFSVKDPASIDWAGYEYSSEAELITPDEWSRAPLLPATDASPTVLMDGEVDSESTLSYGLNGARHILLDNGYAFIVSSLSDTLQVVDVSTPSAPKLIRKVTGLDTVIHLTLSGDYLYATAYNDNAVYIFAVADLLTPSTTETAVDDIDIATLNDGDESEYLATPRATAVADGRLYVVGEENRLVVFDISDLSNTLPSASEADIEITDGTTTYTDFRWIQIEENVAYIAARGQNSVVLVDIPDTLPESIAPAHVIDDGDETTFLANAQHLLVDNGILYVSSAAENAVSIFDVTFTDGDGPVTDNTAPAWLNDVRNGKDEADLQSPRQLAVHDNLLYIPGSSATSDTLNIVDVSDPENPTILRTLIHGSGNFTQLDNPLTVAVDDQAIYIGTSESDTVNIVEHTRLFLDSAATAVLANGGADEGEDETFSFGDLRSVVISGNTAYAADAAGHTISVLDITDPSKVNVVDKLVDGVDGEKIEGVHRLYISRGLLIALANRVSPTRDTVTIYDIATDPTAPERLAILEDSGTSDGMNIPLEAEISGNHLFVTSVEDFITIFDISDPAAPVFVNEIQHGATDANQKVFDVDNARLAVEGSILCASTSTGLQVIDVADPEKPVIISEIQDGANGFEKVGTPGEAILRRGILYLASEGSEDALTIADLSDPANPVLLAEMVHGDGTFSALDNILRMVLDGGILYVPSANSEALTLIDVSDPSNPVLLEEVRDGQTGYGSLGGPTSVAVADNKIAVAARTDAALTLIAPTITVGESVSSWPELTDDLPTQAEVSYWPATFIKWHGAKAFAEYYGCDLPTEAQWEYAAKGGADLDFATADGTLDATKANFNEFDVHPDAGHVEPVKSYSPNPFGLYDLSGNVWEWCRDWYDPDFYASRPNPDYDPYNDSLVLGSAEPTEDGDFVGGPGQDYTGDARVKRGGSWNFHETALGSAERERDYTWRGNDHFGFRIVRASYSLETVSADDFSSRTSAATKLTGVYQERITLKGKDDNVKEYNVAGDFTLIRISDIKTVTSD